MKKMILAFALLAASFVACAEDAKFLIGKTPFVYTVREGAATYDLLVLHDNNEIYQGWGGTFGDNGTRSSIVEDFNDEAIMAKGGKRAFIVWGLAEAKRRAAIRVNDLRPPAPDTNNRMESVVWNIRYNLTSTPDQTDVLIPPAPLP